MTAGKDKSPNEDCPGPASEEAGKADACAGCPNQAVCASAPKGPDPDVAAIAERLSSVKHKVLVLSGKGGVGKSTVSAQLAFALAQQQGCQVGLLDVDICGPSVPKMLGLEGEEIHQSNMGWSPVYVEDNLGVMSIGFLLPDPDDAVIWRGPRKNSLIKQFLKDTYWGELDFLLVDTPPGTSDEHISIAQYLKGAEVDGAIIVTAPQQVSIIDVRKEINFCKKVGIKVLGVVENMSGLEQRVGDFRYRDEAGADVTDKVLEEIRRVAPHLESYMAHTDVFHVTGGGGAAMAAEMGVPFLGRIPLDAKLSQACEEGRSVMDEMGTAPSMAAIRNIVSKLQGAVAVKKDVPAPI